MNINLIYIKLRKTQTAVLKLNDDGTYTILVNSDKPIDVQRKGILHEIGHILYSNSLWIINYFTIIIILAINLSCGKYYFSYFTTFYN